ncbi:unnamed protein product [Aspergillus oryzae]|nr:unnamed protein product [Aspergillus oryzae]
MTPSRPSISWDEVNNAPHEVEWSEGLIGAPAAYQAAEKYEEHVAANGKQARKPGPSEGNPPWACGVFVDRIIETKGLDFNDTKKAKYLANSHRVDIIAEGHLPPQEALCLTLNEDEGLIEPTNWSSMVLLSVSVLQMRRCQECADNSQACSLRPLTSHLSSQHGAPSRRNLIVCLKGHGC